MVAPNRDGEVPLLRMGAHGLRDGLGDLADEARVLEHADRRVGQRVDGVELVVAIEEDGPAELAELRGEPGVDEVDGALVDAGLGLQDAGRVVRRVSFAVG